MWIWLLACSGSGVGNETDDPNPTGEEAVETLCDDGVDNDEDGMVDCDDPDCADLDLEFCSWPTEVGFETHLMFDANAFAEAFGVSDCQVLTTSNLARDRNEEDCDVCDRVFCGAFAYPTDTCPEEEGLERPTEGCFGLVFTSDAMWTIYGRNPEDDSWNEIAVLGGPPPYSFTASEPANYEGNNVGTITTTFTVSP